VRNRAFLGCVIDAGVMYALYLGFISTAPYIVKEMTGQPATTFGLYVLFLSSGYFLGNLYVSRLRGHAALDRVARFGTLLQAVTACAALAFVLLGFTAPIWWFLPMLPLAFAQGLALPHVTATAATVCEAMAIPITLKMAPSTTLLVLKWLVVPRAACTAMSATSTSKTHAVTAAARRASRGQSGRCRSTHASVAL
jgi:hypothetical protein